MAKIEIVLGRAQARGFDPVLLQDMFRLRYEIFYRRLGWEVDGHDGMERDRYDELDPVYMVACENHCVTGCWRMLPTTGPYMLRDTFPQLLGGGAAPQDPAVWELSRFAVRSGGEEGKAQANLGNVTFAMLRAAYDYARRQGIRAYVTVTSVALERLMMRAGIPLVRLADRIPRRIGKVRTVACRIAIDAELHEALYGVAARHAPGTGVWREVA